MIPLVSIIIPTYNRSVTVRRAIDSVLAQTFMDLEVVVVDDGSTDDTRAALSAYPEAVRYAYQGNQGPAAARNHGMRLARGSSSDSWTATTSITRTT
jgi:glycosyltransferase involved in cell wall biosynthesis